MASKRTRQFHVQAWFDREDPFESTVLEALDKLKLAFPNAEMKDIIAYGILALSEENLPGFMATKQIGNAEVVTKMQQYASRLYSGIDRLTALIEAGVQLSSSDSRIALDEVRQSIDQDLSREQANLLDSVADQYQGSRTFDIEDDD